LETLAGVQKVLQCHGSFATATCLECRQRVPGTDIEADILSRKVPLCKICNTLSSAPIKPKGKKSKKKAKGQWDSDVEDESDGPEYPPGIMKVLYLRLIPSLNVVTSADPGIIKAGYYFLRGEING